MGGEDEECGFDYACWWDLDLPRLSPDLSILLNWMESIRRREDRRRLGFAAFYYD